MVDIEKEFVEKDFIKYHCRSCDKSFYAERFLFSTPFIFCPGCGNDVDPYHLFHIDNIKIKEIE